MVEERTAEDIHPDPGPSNPAGVEEPSRVSLTSSWTTSTGEHSRRNSDDWDAIELREIETQQDDDSTGSISSGEYRITPRRTISRTSQRSREPRKGVLGKVQRFWTRNVVLTVPQKSNRDYFALERTFLAYIRTSVVLAMQGVLIAQLFRLQVVASPSKLGYHEVGVPLSITCHAAAIATALMGAHRFWKQQSAVALGTVYAGGWELNCIALLFMAVALTTFILSVFIAVSIDSSKT